LNPADTVASQAATSAPMLGIWRTIRGYILWSYERGTIQYDVMVTLILLFVFLSPYKINFNDKPIERNPHPIGVTVVSDGGNGFIYQIEASAVQGKDDAEIRRELLRIIEPITGEMTITRYEPVRDAKGNLMTYKVWAQRG
jgi:hypothetical protein